MLTLPKINISEPLVSIIMTCYNEEKTISYSIESLLYQTYKNIEIIIVDDNSTDNTSSILKKYDEEYDNIKVIYNKVNKGCYNCKNEAIEYVNGLFTTFQDADDISHPLRIEYCVKFCLKYNLLFCNILHNRYIKVDIIKYLFDYFNVNKTELYCNNKHNDDKYKHSKIIKRSRFFKKKYIKRIPAICIFIRSEIFGIVGNYDLSRINFNNRYSCDTFFEYKIIFKFLNKNVNTDIILDHYYLVHKDLKKIKNSDGLNYNYINNKYGIIMNRLYFSYRKETGTCLTSIYNNYAKDRYLIVCKYIKILGKLLNPEEINNPHIKKLVDNLNIKKK